MNAARQTLRFVEEEKNVLRTLLYFDIFNYPLTEEEIIRFSRSPINFSIRQVLENLITQGIIFQIQNFYSLRNEPQLVLRRLKGNNLAKKKMKAARRFTRLIAGFPFVRAVMLSGSISKNYMDEKSDIDYFIITDTNRLWIVRAALALFRRIFLFNSHKNLCTNYFIDRDSLEIKEKNIYTAIELCTLKPMYGGYEIENFRMANGWTNFYLPNAKIESIKVNNESFFLKKGIEKVFSFEIFGRVNQWLMNQTISYWKRRYAKEINPADFEIAFRSTTGISKNHRNFFQKKVLSRYDQMIKEFEMQNGIDLIG